MDRRLGYLSILLAAVAVLGVRLLSRVGTAWSAFGVPVDPVVRTLLSAAAVVLAAYGVYAVVTASLLARAESKRRRQGVRNLLRLGFGAVAAVGVFGALTEQWLSVLVSLGIVGFAVTFALQQPLFSLAGWVYITVARPYHVGDRVAIGDSRGDVVSVGLFVTTLWEIGGLVTTNQPSGRIITVPNSVVLSSHVTNFYGEGVPHVWNELTVQVAYESDLDFAADVMCETADDLLGDEMAAGVAEYRERLAETPVELEVVDRPSVNVVQTESWVELKLRYLVHPRRSTRTRTELYDRILAAFNDSPDRIDFPVGRNR